MDSSLAASSSSTTPSHQTRPSAQLGRVMYTNAVYFHNGHIARGETPANLDYACINLVYYAYASIAPDGIVNVRTKELGQYAALAFFGWVIPG